MSEARQRQSLKVTENRSIILENIAFLILMEESAQPWEDVRPG